MEARERGRGRDAQDGALRAPSPYSPGAPSFPRKREPTGGAMRAQAATYPIAPRPHRAPTPVPSPAAFAASSPLIGRGGSGRLRAFPVVIPA